MAETPNTDPAVDETAPVQPEVQSEDDIPANTVTEPRRGTSRRGWVWVQNDETGRRFDVREDRLKHMPGVTPVKGVPLHYGESARLPKGRRDLGGLITTVETVPEPPAEEAPKRPSARRGRS